MRTYEITVRHEDGEYASYFVQARTAEEARAEHEASNYGTKIVSVKWIRNK